MQSKFYLKHIDGLRAIAVLSVILYHLGFSGFSGGYVGVDIFFVISGFLITRLIKEELTQTYKFNFLNFYIRRFRRLFPAFLMTLLFCLVVGALLFSIKLYANLGLSTIFALFSLSNIYFWKKVNYFNAESGFDPLLHTWSLSVEEQFYFVWPLLVVLVFKYLHASKLVYFVGLFFLISLCASIYFVDHKLVTFYLLPFRVFEFCIGAMMVWVVNFKALNSIIKELIALVSAICVCIAITLYTNDTSFPSYNALLPCLGAAGLIYAGNTKYFGALLMNKLMVGVGLISYSLYLVHWPLIVFYKYYQNTKALTINAQLVILFISLVAAYFMYSYIEQPFRKSPAASNKSFFSYSILIVAAVSFVSLAIYVQDGWAWRSGNQPFIDAKYGGQRYAWDSTVGDVNVEPIMTIYGDSHAKQYMSAFNILGNKNQQSYQFLTHPACMSLPDIANIYQGTTQQTCINMYKKLKDQLKQRNTTLLLAYRYTKNIQNLRTGERVNYKEKQNDVQMLLNALEKMLEEVGGNQKVIILGGVPATNSQRGYIDCVTAPVKARDCYAKFPLKYAEFSSLRGQLRKFSQSRKQVLFLDPYDVLCDESFCYVSEGNEVYYSDHAHLSKIGSKKVIQYFWHDITKFINLNRN